jgi:site-specific recombinase XerD
MILEACDIAVNDIAAGRFDGIERELAYLFRQWQAKHVKKVQYKRLPNISKESAINEVIAWMEEERGLSPNYQSLIRYSLDTFSVWIKDAPLRAIRTADLTEYLSFHKQRGLAPGSLKVITVSLRVLFHFLLVHGVIRKDPAATLEYPIVRSRIPEVLTRDEMRKLLFADLRLRPYPLRDRAIIELFYSSGVRLSELCNATLTHLDLQQRTIRVTGKGNKTRIIPVNHVACKAITDYLHSERPSLAGAVLSDEVFLSRKGRALSSQMVRTIVKDVALSAGIQRVRPHLLRHTMATDLMRGGADLRVIQELLGHENLSTTETYLHLDATHLQNVIKQFHPRGTHERASLP